MNLCARIIGGEECVCGSRHGADIRLFEPSDMERVLLKVMPRGSHALYTGKNEQLKKKLGDYYRITALFFDGYKRGEDIRLVISDGDDESKYIAYRLNVPHVIIGTEFERTACVSINNVVSLKKCNPPVIIVEEEDMDVSQGFASVVLRYLSLFDWDISAVLFENKVCSSIFKEAKKTINSLMASTEHSGKNSAALKKAIIEAELRLSVLGGDNLEVSGASQAAAALAMLLKHEERESKSFTENAFLLSGLVARCYAAFLEFPPSFCPPPDNNLRLSRLNEYLGVDEMTAIELLCPPLSQSKTELTDYRLKLYRTQLKQQIYDVCRVLNNAIMVFLKLNPDDGYGLKNYISALDSSLCIGLGSDVLHGDTLLSYMRHKGVLDKYIL